MFTMKPITNRKVVSTFDDIPITKKNTLVLCDIDETVLTPAISFKQVYNNELNRLLDLHRVIGVNPSTQSLIEEAHKNAVNQYFTNMNTYMPIHTDMEGFEDFLVRIENMNSTLMFITARTTQMRQRTEDQLAHLGIDHQKYKIQYSGDIPKGEFIKTHIQLNPYSDVLFIDDKDEFIKSVNSIHPQIKCYKFVYIGGGK